MVSVKSLIQSGTDVAFAAEVLMSVSKSGREDFHILSRLKRFSSMNSHKYDHDCRKRAATELPPLVEKMTEEEEEPEEAEPEAVVEAEAEAARVYDRNDDPGPMPPPAMPENVRARIEAMGGVNISLIIQKRLNETDMGERQNSLAMPFGKIFNGSHEFLTAEERAHLSRKRKKGRCNGIGTRLLDTRLEILEEDIPLKKWVMKKESGARSEKYALHKHWNEIVKTNDLEAGKVVQIWAFRVDDQLHLALVKIDEE